MGLTLERMKYADEIGLGYAYFNQFREALTEISGTKTPRFIITSYFELKAIRNQPFIEIQNHADNEGYLDSADCENLIEDFAQYEDAFKLKYDEESDLYETYQRIYELIQDTAQANGVIRFK